MKYDQTDPKSIEKFARDLVGRSLCAAVGTRCASLRSRTGKGGLGQLVEEAYFGISPGNSPEPDFKEAGVELKTFPVRRRAIAFVAKERVSLGMIDYHAVVNETWEKSSLLRKNALLLFLAYLYEKEIKTPLDYVFKLASLWRFPPEDLKIIADDWHKIVGKVRQGKAHELSEGDTMYLGAVTKAADSTKRRSQPFGPEAKPRAFSLKQNYVNVVINQILGRSAADMESAVKSVGAYSAKETFEDLVAKKFEPFIGKTIEEIHSLLNAKLNPRAKNYASEITRAILGVQKRRIEEFEKAGITVKTIRLRPNGMPKEDMSFPAFRFKDIAGGSWEESDWKAALEQRFFFVVFQFDTNKRLVLRGVRFWSMPISILEGEARRVWEETAHRIQVGKANQLPKKSESEVCHVRPHAQKATDVDETPGGRKYTKQCFWLNKGFMKEQLTLAA